LSALDGKRSESLVIAGLRVPALTYVRISSWPLSLLHLSTSRSLQEAKLAKGQSLGVTGYLHQREQPSRSGEKKVIQENYAVVVKLR
jgi:hypothetical protein